MRRRRRIGRRRPRTGPLASRRPELDVAGGRALRVPLEVADRLLLVVAVARRRLPVAEPREDEALVLRGRVDVAGLRNEEVGERGPAERGGPEEEEDRGRGREVVRGGGGVSCSCERD